MPRPNPWTLVPAAEYERHMGPEGTDQLRPLAAILGRAYADLRPRRLLVLGVATGNGLEHVDPGITERVVGVDVNIQYVAVARQRFASLGPRLELYCGDLEKVELPPASFDLVWAGLVLEYVDLGVAARRIAGWLAPGGSLVVALQHPSGGAAAASAGAQRLRAVAEAMRLVPPEELAGHLDAAGLEPRQAYLVEVAPGRLLHVARWRKPK
jgi:predicted TPR repeat methyltransferase